MQAKGARRQPGGLAWIAAGAAGSTRGVGHFHPPREAGFSLGAGTSGDDEGTPPRVRFIPDFSCPSPGGEGDRSPPGLAGGVRGSWSLIRQPAARERSALPDSRDSQAWSLSLSLSLWASSPVR